MQSILVECHLDPLQHQSLHPKLMDVLKEGLMTQNGCVVLSRLVGPNAATRWQDFPDATGYEAFVNHFRIEDIIASTETSRRELLSQAISFALHLQFRLAGHGEFEIVVAIGKDSSHDCSVRFYGLRPNERWLDSQLEHYRNEGILAITVQTLN